MRKQRMIWLVLLMGLATLEMASCAHRPPPVPGSVNLVNKNEGAYGDGTLFPGNYWSKDDLFAKCRLTAQTKEICSRCLTEFDMNIEKDVDLHYELKGELSIMLDDSLKDEIIVDYPMKVLCREDCKGLCPQCGKNLNKGPCSCK